MERLIFQPHPSQKMLQSVGGRKKYAGAYSENKNHGHKKSPGPLPTPHLPPPPPLKPSEVKWLTPKWPGMFLRAGCRLISPAQKGLTTGSNYSGKQKHRVIL